MEVLIEQIIDAKGKYQLPRLISRGSLSPQLPCHLPAVAVSPVEGNAPKPPSRRRPDGLIPIDMV